MALQNRMFSALWGLRVRGVFGKAVLIEHFFKLKLDFAVGARSLLWLVTFTTARFPWPRRRIAPLVEKGD